MTATVLAISGMLARPQLPRPIGQGQGQGHDPQSQGQGHKCQGHSHMLRRSTVSARQRTTDESTFTKLSSTRNRFNNAEQSLNCYSVMGNHS